MNISTGIRSVNSLRIGGMIRRTNKIMLMGRRELTPQELDDSKRLRKVWDERKRILNLTQDAAADLMGFRTQGAVSHYLNAKIPLNVAAKLKFAQVLQMRPSEIWPSSELDELSEEVTRSFTSDDREIVEFRRQLVALPDTEEVSIWRDALKVMMRQVKRASRRQRGFPRGEPPAATDAKRRRK